MKKSFKKLLAVGISIVATVGVASIMAGCGSEDYINNGTYYLNGDSKSSSYVDVLDNKNQTCRIHDLRIVEKVCVGWKIFRGFIYEEQVTICSAYNDETSLNYDQNVSSKTFTIWLSDDGTNTFSGKRDSDNINKIYLKGSTYEHK